MRDYRKQQIGYAIRDFFKECKTIIAIAFIIVCIGFIFGYASVKGQFQDDEIIKSACKILFRMIFTLTICYAFIFISSYNNYLLIFGIIAFLFAGFRAGVAVCYLITVAKFSGIISLVFVYLPSFCVSFILLTMAMSISLGYSGVSPKGSFANTCPNIQKTILFNISAIYIINIIFLTVYILIFGNFFNAVYINI